MTSSLHGFYELGYTRATMGSNSEQQWREPEQNSKNPLSPDCYLQWKAFKAESLVIENQLVSVNL